MIYVTLGTMFLDFPRLVRAADAIAAATGERVVLQRGLDKTPAPHCEDFDFKAPEEVRALQAEARVIVAHAGIGATRDALSAARPVLLVPRLKRFREHMNDHQAEIAEVIQRRGWGRAILDIEELPAACASPPPAPERYQPAVAPLVKAVRTMVTETALAKRKKKS